MNFWHGLAESVLFWLDEARPDLACHAKLFKQMITAEEKRRAIDAIAKENDGLVTPNRVVEAAKNLKHVLHECFIWDDQVAAHEHRLDTARRLIASVEVLVEFEDVIVSAVSYVHDPKCGRRGQGYRSVSSLARRHDEAQQVLSIELERIEASIERARLIAGELGLSTYFEAMLANATEARIRMQRRKSAQDRRRTARLDKAAQV